MRRNVLYIVVFFFINFSASAEEVKVVTIAGSGEFSSTDGSALEAGVAGPTGIFIDHGGTIFFTQADTPVVRKITQDKRVITVVGKIRRGHKDGPVGEALFKETRAVAVGRDGTIYVGDHTNVGIRKVSPEGMVTTIAGPLHGKFIDIKGHERSYWIGLQFCFDLGGNILFGTTMYPTYILRVTPGGVVSRIAGNGKSGYVDGKAENSEFGMPSGIAFARDGSIFVADGSNLYRPGNNVIRKISTDGIVSTFAGSGKSGLKDGSAREAEFNSPMALALDAKGNVYVSDTGNHCIRMVTTDGTVKTIAGIPGKPGFSDGPGKNAQFNTPMAITIDGRGNLLVADRDNHRIRKIVFP